MSLYKKEFFLCILENIPWHKNNPDWISKNELILLSSKNCSVDNLLISGYIDSTIFLLDLFDIIEVKDDLFRIKGQIPYYFVNSLKWFIANDEKILSNWDRYGVAHDINVNNLLEKGPYFLKLLEQKKKDICLSKNLPIASSRKQRVSIVLIKTKFRNKHYFLYQWDTRAEQYQLIGGRNRVGESDFETAKREFNEELQLQEFVYNKDYTLEPVALNIGISDISRTFGALTDYNFSLYLAKIKTNKIKLTQFDRWISIDEMEKGLTKNGNKIVDSSYFKLFNKNLHEGFKGVDNSLNKNQVSKFLDHVGLNPSFFGISINLNGLLDSLINNK